MRLTAVTPDEALQFLREAFMHCYDEDDVSPVGS